MKTTIAAAFIGLSTLTVCPALAQQKCEGPPELCAQIQSLQTALKQRQDTVNDMSNKEKVSDAAEVVKDKTKEDMMKRAVAGAAVMGILLKVLLSVLKNWKEYFTTDKGKAWLKASTLVVGLLAFVVSNVGYGIPFWESLILAGGGPASIAFHELGKLIPVIQGKAKYTSTSPPPPPADTSDPTAPPTPPTA